MVKTKNTVSTHKPLNLNCSAMPKSLMCGSFNVQPTKENNYPLVVGDNYEKRIQTLQSKEVQEAVKRYIQEQEGKDVFEYSVFGSPNQKIGQFAQSKLGDFNA